VTANPATIAIRGVGTAAAHSSSALFQGLHGQSTRRQSLVFRLSFVQYPPLSWPQPVAIAIAVAERPQAAAAILRSRFSECAQHTAQQLLAAGGR
jgi:hypothetical protein